MQTGAVTIMCAVLALAGAVAAGCSRDGSRTAAPAATPTAAAVTPAAGSAASGEPGGKRRYAPSDLEQLPEGPLVIWAQAEPDEGVAPLTVRFKVDEMEDIEGPTYTWDFGDGSPTASGSEVSHTYTKPGSYVVTVTVRDAHGKTGDDRTQVDVLEPAKEGDVS